MPARPEIREGQCESCHIFIDGMEEHYLEEYRGHNICLWCQNQWWVRGQKAGRVLTWDEFRKGRIKVKRPQKLTPRGDA